MTLSNRIINRQWTIPIQEPLEKFKPWGGGNLGHSIWKLLLWEWLVFKEWKGSPLAGLERRRSYKIPKWHREASRDEVSFDLIDTVESNCENLVLCISRGEKLGLSVPHYLWVLQPSHPHIHHVSGILGSSGQALTSLPNWCIHDHPVTPKSDVLFPWKSSSLLCPHNTPGTFLC